MEMNIDFRKQIEGARKHYAHLAPAKFDSAIARALNATAAKAKTKASRDIRKTYKISARQITRSLSLRRASAKNNALEAHVWAEGRPLAMIAFGARQTRKGVTVNVMGARKLIPGAFIATMKSGHRGVFAKIQKRGRSYDGGDLDGRRLRGATSTPSNAPIGELKTVGVPKAFSNAAVIRALVEKSRAEFPPILAHQLRWYAGEV